VTQISTSSDYAIRARLQGAMDQANQRRQGNVGDKIEPRPTRPQIVPVPANVSGFSIAADAYKAKFDADRLRNLKTNLPVEVAQMKDAATRFQENSFGRVVAGGAGSQLDGLRGLAGVNSRNPIDQQGLGMITDRNGMLSEDPKTQEGESAKDSDWVDAISNFASSVFGSIVGKFEHPAVPAWSLLTAPGGTGTEDGPANIGEAVKAFGRMSNGEYYHEGMKDVDDGTKEPVPDDTANSGGPRIITQNDIRGLEARRNAAGEPTGDEGTTGGAINTGANGAGKTAGQSEPVNDFTPTVAVTQFDSVGLEARRMSRILIIR
jgi:hypothetical protein